MPTSIPCSTLGPVVLLPRDTPVHHALLIVAALAACAPSTAFAGNFSGLFQQATSCSTDPNHGRNTYNDFTGRKSASAVFHEPHSAALAAAAARNATREMVTLLKQGANPNARGDRGITMLGWAMRRGSHDAFETLLDAGADAKVAELDSSPTPNRDNGRTVVHYAAMDEDPAYLGMLLAHHVSPDLRTSDGVVPLVESLMSGCNKQFRELIAARANVNVADSVGDTPLHIAAQINSFERALDLLNAGANPAARNHTGKTFQVYLRMTPEKILSPQGRTILAQIDSWLTQHQVPLEHRAE